MISAILFFLFVGCTLEIIFCERGCAVVVWTLIGVVTIGTLCMVGISFKNIMIALLTLGVLAGIIYLWIRMTNATWDFATGTAEKCINIFKSYVRHAVIWIQKIILRRGSAVVKIRYEEYDNLNYEIRRNFETGNYNTCDCLGLKNQRDVCCDRREIAGFHEGEVICVD